MSRLFAPSNTAGRAFRPDQRYLSTVGPSIFLAIRRSRGSWN
jgi:hypothetical protein